jgi:hypothetical protein
MAIELQVFRQYDIRQSMLHPQTLLFDLRAAEHAGFHSRLPAAPRQHVRRRAQKGRNHQRALSLLRSREAATRSKLKWSPSVSHSKSYKTCSNAMSSAATAMPSRSAHSHASAHAWETWVLIEADGIELVARATEGRVGSASNSEEYVTGIRISVMHSSTEYIHLHRGKAESAVEREIG